MGVSKQIVFTVSFAIITVFTGPLLYDLYAIAVGPCIYRFIIPPGIWVVLIFLTSSWFVLVQALAQKICSKKIYYGVWVLGIIIFCRVFMQINPLIFPIFSYIPAQLMARVHNAPAWLNSVVVIQKQFALQESMSVSIDRIKQVCDQARRVYPHAMCLIFPESAFKHTLLSDQTSCARWATKIPCVVAGGFAWHGRHYHNSALLLHGGCRQAYCIKNIH